MTAWLVFLFPKILIPSFHMWCLDRLPAAVEIYRWLQTAVPTTDRWERHLSIRRGRSLQVIQPVAHIRRTRTLVRSFPDGHSLFLRHPLRPTRLYHGQPDHSERAHTAWPFTKKNVEKTAEMIERNGYFGTADSHYGSREPEKYLCDLTANSTLILGFLVFLLLRSWDTSGKSRGGGGGWWLEAADKKKNRHNQGARKENRKRGKGREMFRA